ncbi:hypothetical protein M501DRAFT_1018371 [Patellaria atrata CBS 101060]|uniref:HIG1 domain-containing protein n=1 Tax=Patellaria atrata CBS 101060 TaxID=1346257 RepID=A0A9P4S6B7_9PEZI|nr:hypothetical protein M501DRAFT_1018371 [Patellaria atrata CBS 101060]
MPLPSQEAQQEHYNATVKGGLVGGTIGLLAGAAGILAANRRFHIIQGLTPQFKVFLVTSSGTFAAIVAADRASYNWDLEHNPLKQRKADQQEELQKQLYAQKSFAERVKDWGSKNRYPIVFSSWVASMGIALGIVSRDKYLTGAQKLVQARVYAQGLTLAVLIASFAFESKDAVQGKGRWETITVPDPNDPTHMIEKRIHHERYRGEDQWRDMIEAEEQRMNERKAAQEKALKEKAKEATTRTHPTV